MNPESALIISDEQFNGYISHEPNNLISAYATQQVAYDINNPNNSFAVPMYQPTTFTKHNPDNTYITL